MSQRDLKIQFQDKLIKELEQQLTNAELPKQGQNAVLIPEILDQATFRDNSYFGTQANIGLLSPLNRNQLQTMNCTLDQAMIDNQASMASERDSGRSCQKIKKVKKVAKKKKSTLPKTNEISEAERKTKKKILPRHSP